MDNLSILLFILKITAHDAENLTFRPKWAKWMWMACALKNMANSSTKKLITV